MLIPCKECGKEISTEAWKCPHCAAFATRADQWSWSVLIFILLMFLMVGGCMSSCSSFLGF